MTDTDPYALEQIGDRPLYIGNGPAADTPRLGPDFDRVISLCHDELRRTTDHYPIHDGPGNRHTGLVAMFDAVRELYANTDGTVLVNCAAGISRSTTTIAILLATTENRSLETAIDTIKEYREKAWPSLPLKRHAQLYLYQADDLPHNPSLAFDPAVPQCFDCGTGITADELTFTFDGRPCHYAVYAGEQCPDSR